MTSTLRPDEQSSIAQKERAKKEDRILKQGVSGAVGLGTAALGFGMSSKILPFLNEYIPADLAIKGISKLNPKIGEFLKKGMSEGLDAKSGLDFIKSKISGNESKQSTQQAPEQQNIIAQYDDKLNAFLEDQINQGRSPLEAGAIARSSGNFNKAITQMEKDHKTNFSSIIESIYGQQQQNQQPQPQMQSQGQGQGPGSQALMALAEKILQM